MGQIEQVEQICPREHIGHIGHTEHIRASRTNSDLYIKTDKWDKRTNITRRAR